MFCDELIAFLDSFESDCGVYMQLGTMKSSAVNVVAKVEKRLIGGKWVPVIIPYPGSIGKK